LCLPENITLHQVAGSQPEDYPTEAQSQALLLSQVRLRPDTLSPGWASQPEVERP
jgi:hypothetical protein